MEMGCPDGEWHSYKRLTKWVMVQNRNSIHPALSRADMVLTISATSEGSRASCENRLAVSMKKGAPGGCPISSL